MKKKILIFLMVIVLIVIVSILVIFNRKINIEDTKLMWNIYDININKIKDNLDPITVSNNDFYWWELKDFDIEDDNYERTLNKIVADIRMCYLSLTDDGTLYTNSNPIRKYRDKSKISKKELEDLNFLMYHELGCINRFDGYFGIVLSNDLENTNRLLNELKGFSFLKETKSLRENKASYDELLYRKVLETSLLKELSSFIVLEYNRLK